MNKIWKFIGLALTLVLLLALTACGPEETTPPDDSGPVDNPASSLTILNEPEAVELAAFGEMVYYHVASGGASSSGAVQTVTIDGMDYRFLGDDLDTMEKLAAYLGQAFTPEAVQTYILWAGIKEHEGQTVQPNADGGSIMEWENSGASLIDRSDSLASFELKVPYGEGQDVEFTPFTVEYALVDGFWRIASNPGELY